MTRAQNLLVVFAIWTIGYLPALGSLQLRGEEGRRVLPAVAMMESASAATSARAALRALVVPQVVGRTYLRKPPLINWLIAASFKISGIRSTWTARLPSTLFVLGVAITFVTLARPALGATGSLVAALCWLTSLGTLNQGRMIEIDAIYTSLFAVALICWLTWRLQGRAPVVVWVVPLVFLGLALLAKGPAVLFFFYALVTAVLWETGRLGELITRWHLLGVLAMLAVFALWLIPLLLELGATAPLRTWWTEMFAPVAGRDEFRARHWLTKFPRGAMIFLPAVLLLPFVRYNKVNDPNRRATSRALMRAGLALFALVLVLPGSYPRYVLPLVPVMCWLVGGAIADAAFVWRPKLRRFIVATTALVAAIALIAVPLHAATYPETRQGVKRNADRINASIPEGEPLFIVDSSHSSFFFYVRASLRFVERFDQVPSDARYVLARASKQPAERLQSLRPQELARTDAPPQHVMVLYKLEPAP